MSELRVEVVLVDHLPLLFLPLMRSSRDGYGDCGTGYICPDRVYDEGGYEPTDANVGRGSEALLKKAIRQLLGE